MGIGRPRGKGKDCRSARKDAVRVAWSRQAEREMGNAAGVTKQGVLEGLVEHLSCGYVVEADHMQNGDLAYIFRCFVGAGRLCVKVKFVRWAQKSLCTSSQRT